MDDVDAPNQACELSKSFACKKTEKGNIIKIANYLYMEYN